MTPAPTPHRLRRALARLAGVGALAAVVIGLSAGPASAHPTLLYTTPVAETADPAAPASIVLVFGEPVTIAPGGLAVTDAHGQPQPLETPSSAKEGHAVTAQLTQTLPAGVYTVTWRVTGADGDLVENKFRFAVGAPLDPLANVDTGDNGPSWLTTLLRWALLGGLTLAAGGLVATAMVARARTVNPALPPIEAWTSIASLTGAVAAAALMLRLAAQTGGIGATAGKVAAVQAGALGIVVFAQAVGRTWLSVTALAVVAVAEAVRAHPNITAPGWGALLTTVHVAAAAIWLGTLFHVLRAAKAWRAHPAAIRWLVFTYARLAIWLVALVVLTGCVSALLLVPLPTLTTTTYGRLLLVKIGLVAAAIGAAYAARRLLHGNPGRPLSPLRPARVEASILVVVLAVTATLTATRPPTDATAGQLPPAAAIGLVEPLGTLAGQIGVGVQASDDRLVVHLATPSREDYYSTSANLQTYTLTGRLLPAGTDTPRDVAFHGCGPGCYQTDVGWGRGDNLLTLHASAYGWTGGVISLIIAWPVTDGTALLAQAVTAMAALKQVVLTETVTSDASEPTGDPIPLTLSASEFLDLQPYSGGQAPQVVTLPTSVAGQTRLALGYPAEARYIELTLDSQHRIIDETQVDPKHVTVRHYTYPHAEEQGG